MSESSSTVVSLPSASVMHSLLRSVSALLPRRLRPMVYLDRLVRSRTGYVVASGPFAGMRYLEAAVGSVLVPKLLGTYECELQPVIEASIAAGYPSVIDIGAAEGYYAVGRASIAALARMNDARVEVRGTCDVDELQRTLAESAAPVLVICDIEGAESAVLDPDAAPALASATLIVEIHEQIVPGVGELLRRRFAATHDITEILERDRTAAMFPFREGYARLLPPASIARALSEKRGVRMSWLVMRPRA
jgi:hypothetical protein